MFLYPCFLVAPLSWGEINPETGGFASSPLGEFAFISGFSVVFCSRLGPSRSLTELSADHLLT